MKYSTPLTYSISNCWNEFLEKSLLVETSDKHPKMSQNKIIRCDSGYFSKHYVMRNIRGCLSEMENSVCRLFHCLINNIIIIMKIMIIVRHSKVEWALKDLDIYTFFIGTDNLTKFHPKYKWAFGNYYIITIYTDWKIFIKIHYNLQFTNIV